MSAPHGRTTAILAAGALATSLAGCSLVSGAEGETMSAWGQAGIPAAQLLAVADLPAGDWVQQPPSPDDDSDDTGGVCAFDFDEVAPTGPEGEAAFASNALGAIVSEDVIQVPDAPGVLTQILAQLEGCTGPAQGGDADTAVTLTSRPSAVTVPGAAVAGCRDADITLDGTPLVGTFCFGAADDVITMVAVMTVNPAGALTPDQISALAGTALAKASA